MQVACEVRRVLSRKPNSIKLDHFRLKFKTDAVKMASTAEQAATWSKAIWLGRLGVKVPVKRASLKPVE